MAPQSKAGGDALVLKKITKVAKVFSSNFLYLVIVILIL